MGGSGHNGVQLRALLEYRHSCNTRGWSHACWRGARKPVLPTGKHARDPNPPWPFPALRHACSPAAEGDAERSWLLEAPRPAAPSTPSPLGPGPGEGEPLRRASRSLSLSCWLSLSLSVSLPPYATFCVGGSEGKRRGQGASGRKEVRWRRGFGRAGGRVSNYKPEQKGLRANVFELTSCTTQCPCGTLSAAIRPS